MEEMNKANKALLILLLVCIVMFSTGIIMYDGATSSGEASACYEKCVNHLYQNQFQETVYKKYVNPIHLCMPSCGVRY